MSVKSPHSNCPNCSEYNARIRFIEKTIEESLPEVRGIMQDVTTCLNRLDETLHGVFTVEKTMNDHDKRLRAVEDFKTGFEAAKEAVDKNLNRKIAIMTVVIAFLMLLSNWFVIATEKDSIKQEILAIHQTIKEELKPKSHSPMEWAFPERIK